MQISRTTKKYDNDVICNTCFSGLVSARKTNMRKIKNTQQLDEILGPPLMNTAQVAYTMGVAHTTVDEWRTKGIGPAWSYLGKRVVYDPLDVKRFKENIMNGIPLERA